MDKIWEILGERIANKKATMLVTIISEAGSAPRGSGASMLVGENGLVAGTIGGGMLEFKAVEKARTLLPIGQGMRQRYDLTEKGKELGMVCGGQLEVLFTFMASTEANLLTITKIQAALRERKTAWLLLPYSGRSCAIGQAGKQDYKDCYVQQLETPIRVFIFGGGHLGQEIVPLLVHLGFQCIVTDDRPEFSDGQLFPGAEAVFTRDYDKLTGHYAVQPQDYIISVTRGHRGDLAVEKFALKTTAAYIGVVGSKSKIAAVNAQLLAAGFTSQDLARVTAPIGLPIGSETPEEIAVSIAAQLIQKRAELKGVL